MRSFVVAPEMIQARARNYTEWAQTKRAGQVGIDCDGDDDDGGDGGNWKVSVEFWLSHSSPLPSCPTHFMPPLPTHAPRTAIMNP